MPHFDFSLLLTGEFRAWLVQGFLLSLQLTALTLVFALPLATFIALLRLTPSKLLRRLGFLYVEGVRSVLLLVHLLFWYFAAPELLPAPLKAWLYSGPTEVICAVVALTIYTAAYMAEDLGAASAPCPPPSGTLAEVSFIASQINAQTLTRPVAVYSCLALTYFVLCFGLSRVAYGLEVRLRRSPQGQGLEATVAPAPGLR
jgi:His/Glu/Gln/Arg/opine family amino acid ABC transporter permease subunit